MLVVSNTFINENNDLHKYVRLSRCRLFCTPYMMHAAAALLVVLFKGLRACTDDHIDKFQTINNGIDNINLESKNVYDNCM